MRHRDTFSSCHPLCNFLFFALVLLFTMTLQHPAYLAASLGGAICYRACLRGRAAVLLLRMVPLSLTAAVINPLFNHRGVTILWYFPSGNPLTLESMLYGLGAAAMLSAVILWFACYTEVMTSDKFV